jgi:hypothetical protein
LQVVPHGVTSLHEPSDFHFAAKRFGRTKAFVPTRSHLCAPSKLPFGTVVGLMAVPIDHFAEIFRKFSDETTRT